MIPTYNEAENIAELIAQIRQVLGEINTDYEILVIDDDSADDTAKFAEESLGQNGSVIRRNAPERSLSLSVLQGIREAGGSILIVMDADASHPVELIPELIRTIDEGYDLVVASRYCKGGRVRGFPLHRQVISRVACFLARSVTPIKDNTSGFFAVRKSALEGVILTPSGFKIGLEIFVKAKFSRFKEIPYTFMNRTKGKSKLKPKAYMQFLYQVCGLLGYRARKNIP